MMIKIQFLFCQNLNEVRLSATAKTSLELTRLGPVWKSGSNSSRSSRVWNSIISILQGLGGTPLGLCHVESTIISIGVESVHDGILLEQLILCLRLAFRVLGWGSIRHDISPNVVVSPLRRCGSAIGCPAPIPSFSATWLGGFVMTGPVASCCPGPSIQESDHHRCDTHIHCTSIHYDHVATLMTNDGSQLLTDQQLNQSSYLYEFLSFNETTSLLCSLLPQSCWGVADPE